MKRINTEKVQTFESEHIAQLRKIAPECMVLLKSDGTFPLKRVGKIALYGSGARRTIKGGTGSGDVNARHFVNIEEGLENAGFTITTKSWLDFYDGIIGEANRNFIDELKVKAREAGVPAFLMAMGAAPPEPEYNFSLDGEGDAYIYVLARNSGEGSDHDLVAGDIKLTETEIRDINELGKKYRNFILVLNTGNLVELSEVSGIKNILLMGQLGTPSGDVLADVLLGKSYPSGKLSSTWAPVKDYPSTSGFAAPNDTRYTEGIFVGYRYFDTAGKNPEFPFGFGLGFTTFSIASDDFSIENNTVNIDVTVRNTGERAGKEVVQVYYSAPAGKIAKPYQGLVAYSKTEELAAGYSENVSLSFNLVDMASYDETKASYILEKGIYYIRVGNSSRNTHICGAVEISEDITTCKLKNIGGSPDFEDLRIYGKPFTYDSEADEKATVKIIKVDSSSIEKEVIEYSVVPAELNSDECTFDDVISGRVALDDFVGCLTADELICLCIGNYEDSSGIGSVIGNAAGTVAGAAGESTQKLRGKGVPAIVMADGPAGLRLSNVYSICDEGAKPETPAFPPGMFELMDEASMQMLGITHEAMSAEQKEEPKDKFYQYCSAIPVGTALAQSWNDALCKECGDIVGSEMEIFGVHLWLAPAHNIHRSPLCGRNFEYFSEDPVLSGTIAAAVTNGVQSHNGCGATIKHFCCNNQETNRYFSNSILSERALREIYLKSFEICVRKAMPHSVMTSYNLVNGEHACNRKDLLTYVLRDEWKFKGVVMTDWLVTGGIGHRGEKYPCASAAGNVKAGNDITMPGMSSDFEDIKNALSNSEHDYPLTIAELQICAKRVLYQALNLVVKK